MKLHKILMPSVAGLACLAFACRPANASLVTYFDFSNYTGSGTSIASVDPSTHGGPAAAQSSTLTINPGTNGGFGLGVNAGTNGLLGTQINNGALAYLQGPFSSNTGAYLQFSANLTNFHDPIFTYASAQVNADLQAHTRLRYSLDNGATFNTATNFTPAIGASLPVLGLGSYDFSGLNAVDGAPNVVFRLDNFSSVGLGTTVFDNLRLDATPNVVPTPEPETWAMMGLGLAAVGAMAWKRKKSSPQPAFLSAEPALQL